MTSPIDKKIKSPASSKVDPAVGGGKCEAEQPPIAKSTFPIVAVGASAGGLEAFVELLKNLNVKTGMAFVLLQHLDPTHDSLLSSILARATTMPLCEVTNGTVVVPDHVFVMPQNVEMTIDGDVLTLVPRRSNTGELHLPIDHFFKSLALAHKEHAIGIVLSGTGADGAKGITAIASEGGITFAQDLGSAKSGGMPSAAIASGVEFVLNPAGIAQELAVIARIEEPKTENTKPQDLQKIIGLLKSAKGMDFSNYKSPTIQRRISRRITINGLTSPGQYFDYLKANPPELNDLYEDILVKVTSFFRNPESFVALSETVFPAIMGQVPAPKTIRIWVAGCATGEEAYSIAICLLEFLESSGLHAKIEIFATDISDTALTKARFGKYSDSITEQVSPKRLTRFFIKEDGGYRVDSKLRECCVFAKQNLAGDPPFSRLDLISCRNLLIYLTPAIQKRIMATFHFALNPKGFLALGSAETIGAATDLFGISDSPNKIFIKKTAVRNVALPDYVMDAMGKKAENTAASLRFQSEAVKKTDLKANADRAILAKFAPPGVIINDRMEILEGRGDTTPYLMLPQGEITANLSKMCRPGLLVELRHAIHEAGGSGATVMKDGWIKVAGKKSIPVVIDVVPFKGASESDRYFAVLFGQKTLRAGERTSEPTAKESIELQRVERELMDTKDYLNAIIEKEQAINEELKSASEEILSANEELQSTNEEMATAKEETQATNEELTTVNDELQDRNAELDRLNNDLSNLFGSVQIPIVMLSDKLVIRRFTQSAEKIFNLSQTDIGRPLADVVAKFQLSNLPTLVSEVIESLNTIDQDIQNSDGKWYSLRIRPYRTSENKIEGAVIALVDIDSFKRSFNQLKEAHEFTEAIVQTTPIPLLVLDAKLSILTANHAFCRHFQINESETKNIQIYDLAKGQWDAPKLRELLDDILPKNEIMENFIVDHEFEGLGRRILRLSARRLVQQNEKTAKILLAIQDLTEEKRFEEAMTTAKDAAETANQAKTDFLANMSHEIRTPLGVILGYSEILSNPNQSPSETIHSATRIRKNVEHLTELINEILDIAKIEAGKFDVEMVRFALLPELAETFSLLQNRAEGKGLALDVNFHGDIPEYIVGCPKRLRQILFNIIGNAVKFTERGGVNIDIGVKCKSSNAALGPIMLSFDIKDSGCGLSIEQQSRLFKSFSQADNSVTRKFGGTGLGLMLARRLAEALGGNVVLTNSAVGKGSTFTITVNPGSMIGVSMIKDVTQDSLELSKVVIKDWFQGSQRLAGMHILLVEDGPDNQALIAHFLTSSGATVELAKNGLEGIEMAQAAIYDIILMDIQMPVLGGYEATRRLRDAGYTAKIVALTANAMQGEREKYLSGGFDDYISKPVKPGTLVDIVHNIVKKKVVVPDKNYRSSLADDPLVGPLVAGFVKNLPLRLASLQSAQARSDWREVAQHAHQMSGAAGGYGFPEISRIAARLESQAKDNPNPKLLAGTINAFNALCSSVMSHS